MKQRHEIYDVFHKYVKNAENTQERRPVEFRCDNAKETPSQKFSDLCINLGINIFPSPPYSKPSNGVAERLNRILVEKA